VALPFIVALGFATAALSLDLAARFGASNAFWIMAAGFCTIGIIAGVVVSQRERETAAVEAAQQAEETDQSGLGGLGPIDIQDSRWESALIHCAPDQLIRGATYGEAIRAQ
jgi:hypothetical protein